MDEKQEEQNKDTEFRRISDKIVIEFIQTIMKEFPDMKSNLVEILGILDKILKKQEDHDKVIYGNMENLGEGGIISEVKKVKEHHEVLYGDSKKLGEGGLISEVSKMKVTWSGISVLISSAIGGLTLLADYFIHRKHG